MPKSSSEDSDSSTDLSDGPVVFTREQKAARKTQSQRDIERRAEEQHEKAREFERVREEDERDIADMLREASELASRTRTRARGADERYRHLLALIKEELDHPGQGHQEKIRDLQTRAEEMRDFAEQQERTLQEVHEVIRKLHDLRTLDGYYPEDT
jgi:predicted transcriptional regulator